MRQQSQCGLVHLVAGVLPGCARPTAVQAVLENPAHIRSVDELMAIKPPKTPDVVCHSSAAPVVRNNTDTISTSLRKVYSTLDEGGESLGHQPFYRGFCWRRKKEVKDLL